MKAAENENAQKARSAIMAYYNNFKLLAQSIYDKVKADKLDGVQIAETTKQIAQLTNLTSQLLSQKLLSTTEAANINSSLNALQKAQKTILTSGNVKVVLQIVANALENINTALYRENQTITTILRTPDQAANKELQDQADEYKAMFEMYHANKQMSEKDWENWMKENPEQVKAYNALNSK